MTIPESVRLSILELHGDGVSVRIDYTKVYQ